MMAAWHTGCLAHRAGHDGLVRHAIRIFRGPAFAGVVTKIENREWGLPIAQIKAAMTEPDGPSWWPRPAGV